MGSSVSQFPDPVPIGAAPAGAPSADPSAPKPEAERRLFESCWSCRALSGLGLVGAGGYVYWAAKRPMKLGHAPGPGLVAQMTVGISIACWGVIILTDPKGKAFRVS